jgi:diaminohydroxyphosphoribosylaminopyrimidine deaminase/5-amino-6-(5-phosphoribosylamino)uracil reductase
VIAKWAQTADGYLALEGPLPSGRGSPEKEGPLPSGRGSPEKEGPLPSGRGSPSDGQGRWISNELSRAHVHQVRGVCDGIVVGIGTVLADDPMLNARQGSVSRQPLRVVLDCELRIPLTSKLVQTVREFPLAIIASAEGLERNKAKAHVLQEAGAEVVAIDSREPGRLDLEKLLIEMGRRQWTRVLIEGGPTVLREALDLGLADEVMVYVSPARVGAVVEDLPRLDIAELAPSLHMTIEDERRFGNDRWVKYCRGD